MKRFLKEPLLHFVLLGAALFIAYGTIIPANQTKPDEIIVSAQQIEQLAARFSQFRQRPPTADELKGLIDQYVREEILSREAVKLGLDQGDAVIRRRLQQKMEFVATDLAATDEPTEAELADWLAAHPENFRQEARFTFRHVYLNPDDRGDQLDTDVSKLLADLKQAGAQADLTALGDSFLLPQEFSDMPRSEVASQFGPEFSATLAGLTEGEWTGPIRSGFGVHIVLLTWRAESRMPSLDEVRDQVRREVTSQRLVEANRRLLDSLLAKYSVKLEWPAEGPGSAGTTMAETP
jgi:hypothetical protein